MRGPANVFGRCTVLDGEDGLSDHLTGIGSCDRDKVCQKCVRVVTKEEVIILTDNVYSQNLISVLLGNLKDEADQLQDSRILDLLPRHTNFTIPLCRKSVSESHNNQHDRS